MNNAPSATTLRPQRAASLSDSTSTPIYNTLLEQTDKNIEGPASKKQRLGSERLITSTTSMIMQATPLGSLRDISTFGVEIELWGKVDTTNNPYDESRGNYEVVDLQNPLAEEKVANLMTEILCANDTFDITLDAMPASLLEFRTLPNKTDFSTQLHAFTRLTGAISSVVEQLSSSGGRPISLQTIFNRFNDGQSQECHRLKTDLVEPLNDRLSEVGFLAEKPIQLDDLRLKPQLTFTLPLDAVHHLFRMPPEQSARFLDSRCAPAVVPTPIDFGTIPQGAIENRAADMGEEIVRAIELYHSIPSDERGQLRGLMQLISYIGIHSIILGVNAFLIDNRFNRVTADSKDQFRFLPRSNLANLLNRNFSDSTKQLLKKDPAFSEKIYQSCLKVATELGGLPFEKALKAPYRLLKPAQTLIHSAMDTSEAFNLNYFDDFLGGLCTQVEQQDRLQPNKGLIAFECRTFAPLSSMNVAQPTFDQMTFHDISSMSSYYDMLVNTVLTLDRNR